MSKPTLILIFQAGCPACRVAKPLIAEFAAKNADKVRFERLDLSARKPSYDAQVTAIPALRLENSAKCAHMTDPLKLGIIIDPEHKDKAFEKLQEWLDSKLGVCPVKRPKGRAK